MMNTKTLPPSAIALTQFDQHLTASRKANQLKHLMNFIYGNTGEIVDEMGEEAYEAILGIAADLSAEIDATLNRSGALHA